MTREQLTQLDDTDLAILIASAQAEANRRTLQRWHERNHPTGWKRIRKLLRLDAIRTT